MLALFPSSAGSRAFPSSDIVITWACVHAGGLGQIGVALAMEQECAGNSCDFIIGSGGACSQAREPKVALAPVCMPPPVSASSLEHLLMYVLAETIVTMYSR